MTTASDPLLPVSEIVARLPGSRGARRVHPATVTRWIVSGCAARDGTRVWLAATRVGSRWLVRESDLEAFFAALGAGTSTNSTPCTPAVRTPAARRKAGEAAAAALKKLGA